MIGIEVKEVDLDETLNDVESWILIAFSIANELFKKIEPESDGKRIDELSVDMIFEFMKQYIMMPPSMVNKIKDRFYETSNEFFAKHL